ncbi:MAG: sporulation protein [Oscillibacter sp.]|nr:sporulation protein [Oscillibacter sp.]
MRNTGTRGRKSSQKDRQAGTPPGQSGLLDTVAERFDLPADVVAGLPRLELIGSRQLYLEHHAGILSYTEERIDAGTSAGVLRVQGRNLTLLAMTADELRLGGTILSVAWAEDGI